MIDNLVQEQRKFFKTQQTKDIAYRKQLLKRFHKELILYEDAICDALYADFKKPKFEALASETQMILSELKYAIDNLEFWAKPTKVKSIWTNFPSSDWIYPEPFGNVLIIAPWNYPFLLSISPLIGALSAGNTVVLKPSELSPNTSKIIVKIVENVFPKEYVSVVEGGVSVSQELLSKKWDYIFFTGSSRVGKIVYKSAAEHLTPVTLELSGKNPCIVDATASIQLAAKRIVWGKFLNAGQTCIAPDYILVHSSKKDELIAGLQKHIENSYGKDIEQSDDFARIATEGHYNKLKEILKGEDVLFGGSFNDQEQYIAPTLVNEPNFNEGAMADEIFGPILPIISYESEDDIDTYLINYDKPLALYIFSNDKTFQKRIIAKYSFGGGAVNDTIVQIINKKLPFGGVGGSGIGGYHGKHTFDLFSHKKAIVKRANWIDVPVRYAPYAIPIKWAKKIKHLL
ncbi:MAG: aldehyde dehydrogenase family protein [Bacteroidota bacterium]